MRGKYGKIRYHVEASLQTDWDFDIYAKTSFKVIRLEDLSFRFDLMVPLKDETVATFCCLSCKTRPLILSASIPFSGYIPEQNIRLTIKIDNRCGFDVSRTIISLRKKITFISQTPERRFWNESKTLLKNVLDGAKNGRETKIYGIVEIPAFTLPTNSDISSIVKVTYHIHVSVDVVGFVSSPKVQLPIVIGSKPLKFESRNYC